MFWHRQIRTEQARGESVHLSYSLRWEIGHEEAAKLNADRSHFEVPGARVLAASLATPFIVLLYMENLNGTESLPPCWALNTLHSAPAAEGRSVKKQKQRSANTDKENLGENIIANAAGALPAIAGSNVLLLRFHSGCRLQGSSGTNRTKCIVR